MTRQDQFLNVIDRDEAERRFHDALNLNPLSPEKIPLELALGRVLAEDVVAAEDVPNFDRSNFDGFAVRAMDTYGASEEEPRVLRLMGDNILTAVIPRTELSPAAAAPIVTGAMLPRGADSVVMVEDTDCHDDQVSVRRAVHPGYGVTFAGTDISALETVLHQGQCLSSRETGVLAAIGQNTVSVRRRPRVAILSTGDEIVAPGDPMRPGLVYDSNARIVADTVRELGAEPIVLGIVRDDPTLLRRLLLQALDQHDVIVLSGGTSKGSGDISYRVVEELTEPGIVAHGVALKPGKPICLAAHHGKPVVVLPGFPTSAIFTFHEFVAPVILRLGGRSRQEPPCVPARLAVRVQSEIGRTEYLLVGLVHRPEASPDTPTLTAYPLGKGSGSVTTFSRADGFVTIDRHQEIVDEDSTVDVQLLSPDLRLADLVVIGSHCVGLDYLLGQLQQADWHTKFLAMGSMGGLEAARRGECDLAGIHLMDAATGEYNRPWISDGLRLLTGYRRRQGIVHRPDDSRFAQHSAAEAMAHALSDQDCVMINRNRGSGTRVLIEQLLRGAQPAGYAHQARNHNAIAAAIAQRRADWGVAIECVARRAGLAFIPLCDEQYDFVIPASRWERPAVRAFRELLQQPGVRDALAVRGCLSE